MASWQLSRIVIKFQGTHDKITSPVFTIRRGRTDLLFRSYQCCGSALVSMRIRIQFFISMRIPTWIRIQEAKSKRIQADPDPVRLFCQKVVFLHKKNIL